MGKIGKFLWGSTADDNFNEAEELNKKAESLVDTASYVFDSAKEECEKALRRFDDRKKSIFSTSLMDFVKNFSKVKNIDFKPANGLSELEKYTGNSGLFYPYLSINTSIWESSLTRYLGTIMVGSVGGPIGGPIGVGLLRTYWKKKSEVALDNAKANHAEAELIYEQASAAADVCSYITARSKMFISALNKLNEIFVPAVKEMSQIIMKKGNDYLNYDLLERKTIAAAASTASSIKAILDISILSDDGSLTLESKELCIDMANQLSLPCDKKALGNTQSMPTGEEDYFDLLCQYDNDDDNDDSNDSSRTNNEENRNNLASCVAQLFHSSRTNNEENSDDGKSSVFGILGRHLVNKEKEQDNDDEEDEVYSITEDCVMCGTCETECPEDAIYEGEDKYEIDTDLCIGCGLCVDACPSDAIIVL